MVTIVSRVGHVGIVGRVGWAAMVCAVSLVVCPATASAQVNLERARELYNAAQYDEAIAAAAVVAKNKPSVTPSTALIAARARLERFRIKADPADLEAARNSLTSLNPRELAPQEMIEWQIGVGTALFLENQPGPASEMFSTVVPTARERLTAAEFDKVLEWWASTLSRVAESQNGDARKAAYTSMLNAVRAELERNPLSGSTGYWAVVAERGTGDFESAWNAAVATWVRAGSQPAGKQLRADLDRFVTQTLIPERAQARIGQRLDTRATQQEITTLTEQWRALTELWNGPS